MSEADAFPEVGDYAIIGNCRTTALVSKAGSIEWMCLPDFSGASIFAAILDRGAGHFSIAPAGAAKVERAYVPGTNILQTTFRTQTGTLRLTDCMTLPAEHDELEPEHELLRRVECLEGEVDIEVSFMPRPRYGAGRMGFRHLGKLGWQCTHGGFGAMLGSDVELTHDPGNARLAGSARLKRGDSRWLSFTYDESEASIVLPLGEGAAARLEGTADWWREFSARAQYDGPYRDAIVRSVLTLKLLTSSTTGAVLAAPTTSLPEVAGGPRNWDYRYCWIRDSALVLYAFLSLGYVDEAEAFLGWLLHATRLTWERFQVLYDLYGETRIDEKELTHLSGYRGAKPVRIGNAAHDQLQLDIYGELLETVSLFVKAGGTIDSSECRMLEGIGKTVLDLWSKPDHGIWETRAVPRHHTFSKAMCWVTLDRLRALSEKFPLRCDRAKLARLCDMIRAEVEAHGFDEKLGSYVGFYGGEDTDASLLLMARYGYAEPGNARMEGTYRYIERTLDRNGFIHRYPAASGHYDGIQAAENAFAPCNFWAVEYLANSGHYDEAKDRFERLCACANDVGLFAEEMATGNGSPVGNFPQAFTHVSLISAATALYKHKTA
ncbi:MAG TPA: glycoside hydrolase family 15 protein [Usitatibacter sp.]|nr:glycoside hydrolase family 15 protein [Usitatibacter sp.]